MKHKLVTDLPPQIFATSQQYPLLLGNPVYNTGLPAT